MTNSTPTTLEVLYEDNHLIIINKKTSDIIQGDKTGDEPLSEIVKKYIKEKYNKPGDAYLGVVHRLDRPTSGAIIFAKTSKALTRLNAMLQDRSIHKTYWAVVKNKPEKENANLVHYLRKNATTNKATVFTQETPDAKRAELNYKIIKSFDNYHLLEIELLTGRHHQIRAQLSFIGSPIKGDIKYGFARTNTDGSIHLHARNIQFIHPVSKENINITAPVPTLDALWKVCSL